MNRNLVYRTALTSGFNLKEQPDGTMDLNPYVYEFAGQLIGCAFDEIEKLRGLFEGSSETAKEFCQKLSELEEALRSVLKEAGISNVDAAAPGDLPGMVNYKIQHMEKYLNAAREENHRLKNSANARTIQAIHDFVADDAAAVSYQTMGQYRTAVLNMIKEAV